MFTGLIEEVGEIVSLASSSDAARITVHAPLVTPACQHGDSIAVNGVCLTIVDHDENTFSADVMAETLAVSALSHLAAGVRVNLERAARVGDRLGGHIVQGHVDGTVRVISITEGSAWQVVRLALTPDLAPLVARKGSVALNGVSLTVSAVGTDWFEVSLIPETLSATTLGALRVGDLINVETDILARHVWRLLETGAIQSGIETHSNERNVA